MPVRRRLIRHPCLKEQAFSVWRCGQLKAHRKPRADPSHGQCKGGKSGHGERHVEDKRPGPLQPTRRRARRGRCCQDGNAVKQAAHLLSVDPAQLLGPLVDHRRNQRAGQGHAPQGRSQHVGLGAQALEMVGGRLRPHDNGVRSLGRLEAGGQGHLLHGKPQSFQLAQRLLEKLPGHHVAAFLEKAIGHPHHGAATHANRQVRLLAVFGDQRSPVAPDVPSLGEFGYRGFESTVVNIGVVGPPGMPEERRKVLEDAMARALRDAEFLQFTERAGIQIDPMPGDAYKARSAAMMDEISALLPAIQADLQRNR